MKAYWVEFKKSGLRGLPVGTWLGCGVTAYDKEDAIKLLKQLLFKNWNSVPVLSIKENISINDLDQHDVAPDIGNIQVRGIWYPDLGSNL
jgi:hypothetical protein